MERTDERAQNKGPRSSSRNQKEAEKEGKRAPGEKEAFAMAKLAIPALRIAREYFFRLLDACNILSRFRTDFRC